MKKIQYTLVALSLVITQCTSSPEDKKSLQSDSHSPKVTSSTLLPRILYTDIDPTISVKGRSQAEIKDLLYQMYEVDQRYRDSLLNQNRPGRDRFYSQRMGACDAANRILLDKIIEEVGWPTISQFGEKGADAAWLIVWHARNDKHYLAKYLDLMQQAAERKEMDSTNFHWVKERVEWQARQQ
ncbi:hypothetical protein [Telluribacter sp. SYSU D00476]|uniref:hypothetical protein n=1 Tax=Telluribacter sp. SYSU D00476 TaxID=2811430 RepID=UPI001FF66364|nr:hypothetical protein [Telluribacter sp. SYSU D00476]